MEQLNELQQKAKLIRKWALISTTEAGSGHPTSCQRFRWGSASWAQVGRKGSRNVITYAIDLKALPLPIKIMVMRDGGKTSFGDKFRQRKTQRKVKWDRDRVLDDD